MLQEELVWEGVGGRRGRGPGGSVCTFEVQKYPMYLPTEPSFPWLLPIPAATPTHTHQSLL